MTQEERWLKRYNEIVAFIQKNKRNPSRYDVEERGRYCNWLKHQRKIFNAGGLKPERRERFEKLMKLSEVYRRKNQYDLTHEREDSVNLFGYID